MLPDPHATPPTHASSRGRLPEEVAIAAQDPANHVGHYIRLRELGRGGFGAVWLAWDTALSRHVALKFLKEQEPEDVARFRREASLAAGLSHPNIAAIYDVLESPPCIAMQYVEGAAADRVRLTARDAARAVRDAAEAVQHAHDKGVVHRDIKPQNLMIDKAGRVYVMDFGLAKRTDVESSLSQSGIVVGTPSFMSPEQAMGHVHLDARSDVYSLGATLHALVAGRPPFDGTAVEVLVRVVHEEPAPLPGIDRDLATIITHAMDKDPSRRYPSAGALAADLGRWIAGEPILAKPPSLLTRVARRVRKNWMLTIATGLALAGLATAAGMAAMRATERARIDAEKARAAERRERAMPHLSAGQQWLAEAERFAHTRGPDHASRSRASADRAIAPFQAALAEDPALVEALAGIGRAHHLVRRLGKAEEAYTAAIAAAPTFTAAVYQRARLYLDLFETTSTRTFVTFRDRALEIKALRRTDGDPIMRKAIADFERVRELQPQARELAFAAGAIHYLRGRYDQAIPCFDEAIAASGTDEDAFIFRAIARFYDRNDRDGALEDLTRAVELCPTHVNALLWRAVLHAISRKEEAPPLADVDAAVTLDPDGTVPRLVRAYFRGLTGDHAGAAEDYTWLVQRDDSLQARLGRAVEFAALGHYEEVIADCTKAIEMDPASAIAYTRRGNAQWALRRLSEARRDQDRAVDLDPLCAAAWINRAIVRRAQGDVKGALEDYRRGLRIDPADPGAWTNFGNAVVKQDPTAALDAYDRALALKPRHAEAHFGRGSALHGLGRLEEALAAFDTAIDLSPKNPKAHGNRAITLLDLDRPGDAVAAFERAFQLDPSLREQIGDLYEEARRRKQ